MVFEFCNSLWWMLPRALRRLHFSLAIWGQWKRKCSGDSALWQQLLSVIIILETMFEFLFSQMANCKFKPCNEFKLSDFIRTGSKMFHSMIVGGKSVFFFLKKKKKENWSLCLEEECYAYFLSSIDASGRSQTEKILRMFVWPSLCQCRTWRDSKPSFW